MNSLQCQGTVTFPDYQLSFDLTLPGSGVTAFFGESGVGKSTLLRVFAGLERPSNGLVRIKEDIWQDDGKGLFIPTYQRPLGMVFQDARLFPHLSVAKNLHFGMKRVKQDDNRIPLEDIVELLGIGHLLERMPDTLSGGEGQRVAIARALAASPKILMMDEPMASLDQKRRQEILPYLHRLNEELKIPILYVSHSLEEVAVLSDYLVLLERGRIASSGPTPEMLTRLDLPLVHYDGAAASIAGRISAIDTGFQLSTFQFKGGQIFLPAGSYRIGQPLKLRVQARDVSISIEKPGQTSILNVVEAVVVGLADSGNGQVMVELDAKGSHLLSRITRKSAVVLGLEPGKAVFAQVKGTAVIG
ncbi:MAG: molybdenum ABC transporter ATP-binding protein [Oxalobacter sp.]|nr:molybdenum ABC transporter ATP-binding protein [Oxalobacter sp.]